MDRRVLDYLMRRVEEDSFDGRRRRGRSGRYIRDRRDYADYEDREDGRRGVRGSGRGRDRADYDERDYEDRRDRRDYGDYEDERDYDDGHYEMRLTKSDMKHWKHKLHNADGTRGEHYDMQQIMQAAEKLGIKFHEFDEKEFCITVNMMYSDYCKVLKKHVSPEKELIVCAELAKAFLEDDDGPEASEKLALYYYCIANNEEV